MGFSLCAVPLKTLNNERYFAQLLLFCYFALILSVLKGKEKVYQKLLSVATKKIMDFKVHFLSPFYFMHNFLKCWYHPSDGPY